MAQKKEIADVNGRIGVLTVGLGAVGTTLIAGTHLVRKGVAKPIGSLTQMGTIRLGKRTDDRVPRISDFVSLAKLEQLVFGGWDIFNDNGYEAAKNAAVLSNEHIEAVREDLESLKPMAAVFDREYVKKLDGPNVKKGANRMELGLQLVDDIERFKVENDCNRIIIIWCASTEVYIKEAPVHADVATFEQGMRDNDPSIPPSMVYAWAAMKTGTPFINGAPNLTVDVPWIVDWAGEKKIPISGKDFKTGQTLMKTILAPGFKARLIGLNGWFSTNILGNRDGEVLDDPGSFKTKEESKLSVLDSILQPDKYPDLYGDYCHKVRINYYPPRGDNKEGWDNIDIFGWLGYPMQIKVDFLCRDSILAAPVALDLVLFTDLAQRAGMGGIQEWLSFYFKSPIVAEGLYPEHDLFIQLTKLKNTLRYLMGEELITHLGMEYYGYFDEG
ncbi:MAG: inositol-3-phosphate synthase [Deltaproteobacteria bacterium]|nr:inositol-3-phosphate synthase [Deltaproteobacteria bacterium]